MATGRNRTSEHMVNCQIPPQFRHSVVTHACSGSKANGTSEYWCTWFSVLFLGSLNRFLDPKPNTGIGVYHIIYVLYEES